MFRTTTFAAQALLAYAVLFGQPADAPCVQPASSLPITIEVRLPADAHLEIGGYLTRSVGNRRLFASPSVPTGYSYSYVLKAKWHGKEVAKQIIGQPGEVVAVQFSDADFHSTAVAEAKNNTPTGKIPSKEGFVTLESEGRWWIFKDGSKDLASFKKLGEPEKSVTRINVAPYKATLRAPDIATLEEYLTAKPGFVTRFDDGRMWIFRKDSKDLAIFLKGGELEKQVVRTGAGPGGMTLKAPDRETIEAYLKTP